MTWIASVIERAVIEAIAGKREPLTKEELAEVNMEEGERKGVTATIVLRKVEYDEFVQVAHAGGKVVMIVSQEGKHTFVWLTQPQARDLALGLWNAAHAAIGGENESIQKASEDM